MNHKLLTIAVATFALSYSQIACSQDTQAKPAEQTAEEIKKQADEAAAKATAEAKLEKESAQATATPAVVSPEAASASAEVEALKTVFLERRRLNYKKVELDFAKEKALNKNSDLLQQQTDSLYTSAVQSLTTSIGSVSEPQAEETFFEYDVDEDSGEFVIVQVRDSYLKAERGDICQVSTRVHLITSLEKELPSATSASSTDAATTTPAATTTATTEASASADPSTPVTESYTEIKCYNEKRTTYHQLYLK